MSSVSNQPFEDLELRSWQQVLEVAQCPLIKSNQVEAKRADLAKVRKDICAETLAPE